MLRVDSWVSPPFSVLHSFRPFCAHHRGSWPTITSTSGAGQSTSTGRSPAAGEDSCLPLSLRWPVGTCLRIPPHPCEVLGPAFQYCPTFQTSSVWPAAPHSPVPFLFPSPRKGSRGGPSRRGVALLRPEPLHRGTADTFLNRVKKLPCQITRWETGGGRLRGGDTGPGPAL